MPIKKKSGNLSYAHRIYIYIYIYIYIERERERERKREKVYEGYCFVEIDPKFSDPQYLSNYGDTTYQNFSKLKVG